jgi:hypothetical protein
MEYEFLTREQRQEIVRNALLELEGQHYGLTLRLKAYHEATDASEDNKREMVQQTLEQVATLEAAIRVYREEFAVLNGGGLVGPAED